VWDPANAYVAGESAFPEGYGLLPIHRIAHVHAKDCKLADHKATWGELGACDLDWKGQIAALVHDGYKGYISLETHWPGPGGDKHLASMICGRNLKALVTAA
jgi:L-ribulose-5-phosphate 3-epimerase